MDQGLLQYALSKGFNPAQWGLLQNYAEYSGGGLTPQQVFAGYNQGLQAHDITQSQPGVISVGEQARLNAAGTPAGQGYMAPNNSLRGTGQITWNGQSGSWNTPQGAFNGKTYQPYVDANAVAQAQWGNSYQNSNIPGYQSGYQAQTSGNTPGTPPPSTTPPPGTGRTLGSGTYTPPTGAPPPPGTPPPAPSTTVTNRTPNFGATPPPNPSAVPPPPSGGTPPPSSPVQAVSTQPLSGSGNPTYGAGAPATTNANPNFLGSLANRPSSGSGSGYGFSRTGLWRQ
ncbi:MAG: hypothetical protein ACYC9R_06440 [Nitrosotalea sp.]